MAAGGDPTDQEDPDMFTTSTAFPGSLFDELDRIQREMDRSRIDAKLKDGVLTVTIPKAEAAKPHRIEVRNG